MVIVVEDDVSVHPKCFSTLITPLFRSRWISNGLISWNHHFLRVALQSHVRVVVNRLVPVVEDPSFLPSFLNPNPPSSAEPRGLVANLRYWNVSASLIRCSGEPIGRRNTSWTVTIERNTAAGGSHLTPCSTGYLFGVGVASEVLSTKELVGTCAKSHGLICSEGAILFSHNSAQEHVVALPASLPVSITLSVTWQHDDHVMLTYKLTPSDGDNTSLVGRRLLTDAKLKEAVLPVFSVSQRVKLLFPTFV